MKKLLLFAVLCSSFGLSAQEAQTSILEIKKKLKLPSACLISAGLSIGLLSQMVQSSINTTYKNNALKETTPIDRALNLSGLKMAHSISESLQTPKYIGFGMAALGAALGTIALNVTIEDTPTPNESNNIKQLGQNFDHQDMILSAFEIIKTRVGYMHPEFVECDSEPC